MHKVKTTDVLTVAVFATIISSYLLLEAAYRFDPAILNIQPLPEFYSNTLGNLRPNLKASAFSHPRIPYRYSTDSNGFRSNGAEKGRTPDELVLCLGDSFTFGVSVPDAATFPALLEQRLNALRDSTVFRVINAGVPDVGIEDNYLYYLDKARLIRPNLVVVQFNIHDMLLLSKAYRYKFTRQDNRYFRLKDEWLTKDITLAVNRYLKHSKLYRYLSEFLFETDSARADESNLAIADQLLEKRGYTVDASQDAILSEYDKVLDENNCAILSPLWKRYCDVLLKLKKAVEADGIDFLLVIVPHYNQMNAFANAPSAAIIPFCDANNIKYVDMTRTFRSLSTDEGVSPYCHPFDLHCNAVGNAAIAEKIAKRVEVTRAGASVKAVSFSWNLPGYRYAGPVAVGLQFDAAGQPVLAGNPYVELAGFSSENCLIRHEGDGSIDYMTTRPGAKPIGSATLRLRVKQPVEQLGAVFFPHILAGDNRRNAFALTLAANGEEAHFSTSASHAPETWKELEHMTSLLLKPATAPLDAFTLRFSFVGDGGFIFETKPKAGRRFDILLYPAAQP